MRHAAIFTLTLLACACGGAAWRAAPHDRYLQSVPPLVLHRVLDKREGSSWWDSVVHTTLRPASEAISPGRHLEHLIGGTPALDINAFGQVLDSPWYTNRIARGRMTPEEIERGPNQLEGPAPGMLDVIGAKLEGATPGLVIRDSDGNEFIAKFDPPAFPELSSGAEVIAAKILWAAGYNVPENYIHELDIARLRLAPDARGRGSYGESVTLDQAGLDAIILHVNPYTDGKIRAMFSRRIPGRVVGHFDYRGVRRDDPNDRVPHERRRSLRALWMFSAWLHNTDTTAQNTVDAFISSGEDPDLGYIRHYLLDFGDALGAAGTKPKYPGQGYESEIDWGMIGETLFSFGLRYAYWLPVRRSPFRAVGIYEADVFEPSRWRPDIPNPAFDESTPLDDYWAASVLARFTPDLMAAVVDSAEYSEPGASEWVLRVLQERQYKLMEHAFSRVLALDLPSVHRRWRLELVDLEVESGLMIDPAALRYTYRVYWNRANGSRREVARGILASPAVDLERIVAGARTREGAAFERDPFLTVVMQRPRADGGGPSVEIHLRVLKDGLLAVGLDRSVD
jgi:hypothetical protein